MIFQSRLGDPLFIDGQLAATLVKKSSSSLALYYYRTIKDSKNLFSTEPTSAVK